MAEPLALTWVSTNRKVRMENIFIIGLIHVTSFETRSGWVGAPAPPQSVALPLRPGRTPVLKTVIINFLTGQDVHLTKAYHFFSSEKQ